MVPFLRLADRHFKLTRTNDIKLVDHVAPAWVRRAHRIQAAQVVSVGVVGLGHFLDTAVRRLTLLMKDVLASDVLTSMKHAGHLLQVVLRERGEERDGLKELDAHVRLTLQLTLMQLHEVELRDVGEVGVLGAAYGCRAITISQ